MSTEIVVVPHTHWDREWYEPFQRFRLRLVALLDEVLDTMEREPDYHFTLDGQLACVDDYLEVRPENRDRVAALVKSGRLAVGPWQILLDEFLCSGENIIRNLELGMSRADKLGGAMPVGYLPDMFGHTAQMPQILRKAGLLHACVYRGVPSSVTTDAFAWTAPDGTALRTQYLPAGGYGNGAHLFHDTEGLKERAASFVRTMREWHGPAGSLLAMYGTDHSAPVRGLPEMVAAIGARMDTLSGYISAYSGDVEGLPQVHGELRSHARANILPGVISIRPHVKQAMGRAERMVERYAEPLAALWGDEWPGRFLDMAWWRLVDASGHDSVTGCGVDDTAQQVAARIAEAEHLGQAVRDMVTARLAEAAPSGSIVIVNPTPKTRSGIVTLDVAGSDPLVDATGAPVPTQPLEYAATLLLDAEMDPAVALTFVHGTELYGQHITDWSVEGDTLTFTVARETSVVFDMDDLRAAIDGVTRVRIIAEPRRTVAALVQAPPLGHTTVRTAPRSEVYGPTDATAEPTALPGEHHPACWLRSDSATLPVRGDERVLDNGLLRVVIADDGLLDLHAEDGTVVTGAGRIVDGGDVGDTYNYAPPQADLVVSQPVSVETDLIYSGPLVAAVDVRRTYRWPVAGEGLDGAPEVPAANRRAEMEEIVVTMRVELRAGEPFVRLRVEFDNRCDDHRVRLHVPLPKPATESYAEGQFAVVTRALTSEGGCGETPLPTFPASSWVAAGGVAALLEHVTEYEVNDDELALTLLRSVGYLSRNRNALRPEPAGPQLPTPAAQSRGLRTVNLALMPFQGSWEKVVPQAETFRHDLLAVPGLGDRSLPMPQPAAGLSVTGDGVVMTSLRDRDGWLELRVVAMTPDPTEAVIAGGLQEARHADLRGRPGDPLEVTDGTLRLPLGPWEIATVQFRKH
ncbi:glycoside hydrolase family 38 C-terminal domain-containing protein [Nonomuraea sp. NPDC052634]|uniref:glycoside hydrolase family 38 N-terminal domain-containing protein n=1 Tax=Nonomuraea sp. NPDC052634 TaxID=3155813 RepID=UPI003442368F